MQAADEALLPSPLLERGFGNIEQHYFALRKGDDGVVVFQASEVSDTDPLILLGEEMPQSDRFVEQFMP